MDETESAAYLYHQLSGYHLQDTPRIEAPGGLVAEFEQVSAPRRAPELAASLTSVLRRRLSIREFTGAPISRDDLEFLLWCGNGRTDSGPVERRTIPSAGGVYPLELIVAAQWTDGLERGWYHYHSGESDVESLTWAGPLKNLAPLFRTRHVPFEMAGAVILLGGSLSAVRSRYGERGYRFLLFEAGHAAQNMLLAAATLGLAAVPLGGFDDELVADEVPMSDSTILPLYVVAVGEARA